MISTKLLEKVDTASPATRPDKQLNHQHCLFNSFIHPLPVWYCSHLTYDTPRTQLSHTPHIEPPIPHNGDLRVILILIDGPIRGADRSGARVEANGLAIEESRLCYAESCGAKSCCSAKDERGAKGVVEEAGSESEGHCRVYVLFLGQIGGKFKGEVCGCGMEEVWDRKNLLFTYRDVWSLERKEEGRSQGQPMMTSPWAFCSRLSKRIAPPCLSKYISFTSCLVRQVH